MFQDVADQLRNEIERLKKEVRKKQTMPYVHGAKGGFDLEEEVGLASVLGPVFLGDAKKVRELYFDDGGFKSGFWPWVFAVADVSLRSIGEVVFLDNTWSSLVMLICLFVQDWYSMAWTTVFLVITTIYTMQFNCFPRQHVAKSLYSYNTPLVCIAMSVFAHSNATYSFDAAGTISMLTANVLNFVLVCYFRMSETLAPFTTTLPFNVATIFYLLAANGASFSAMAFTVAARPDPLIHLITPSSNHTSYTIEEALLRSIPCGFGQVFFVDMWPLGLVMWLACFLHSPPLAGFAALGVCSGTLFAYVIGASFDTIASGLWGFNPALIAMLVGLTWPRSPAVKDAWGLPKAIVISVALSMLTTIVTGACRAVLTYKLGVPAFTLPFCIVAALYISILASPLLKETDKTVLTDRAQLAQEREVRHRTKYQEMEEGITDDNEEVELQPARRRDDYYEAGDEVVPAQQQRQRKVLPPRFTSKASPMRTSASRSSVEQQSDS